MKVSTGRMAMLLLAGALVLSACGDDAGNGAGDDPAGTASTVAGDATAATDPSAGDTVPEGEDADVCTLLENLDVDALLGEEGGTPDGDGARCVVLPVDPESTGQVGVGLVIPGGEAYADRQEILGSDSEVEGLGDEAYLTGSWLHVRAGDIYVDLQVVRNPLGEGPRVTDDEMVEAMRTILTNVGMDT